MSQQVLLLRRYIIWERMDIIEQLSHLYEEQYCWWEFLSTQSCSCSVPIKHMEAYINYKLFFSIAQA